MIKKCFNFLLKKVKCLNNIQISDNKFIFIYSLYFTTILNFGLWRYVYNSIIIDSFIIFIFLISLPIVLCSVLYAFFNIILFPKTYKILSILFLLITSITNYFVFELNVFINEGMIINVIGTTVAESVDLITSRLIFYLFFTGIIPSFLVYKIKINTSPIKKNLLNRIIRIGMSFGILLLIICIVVKQYFFYGRNHKQVPHLINPVNYIAAYSHYIRHRIRANKKFVYIDKEAIFTTTNTKKLIVLVVGETSRAKNFSLNGYERETNPLLSKQKDLVNFTDVMSGGTYTGFSVPKMFSHRSKSDFKLSNSDHEENLLDLMKQVGYDVYWKENDSSCKGVCARVRNINYNGKADKDLCDGDYCFDEILLKDFENDIKNIKQDTIIVLHTIGSHGPTYYRRYPKEFKKFTPTCDTAELQSCPTENIVNVYDNTILYVDFVLNKTIEILKKYPQYKSVMLYASDHGESLGENGFYLHGSPYLIAPLVQKHIPMVLWINNKIKKDIDINCIKQKENNKFSHDNIFHTIIGISNIKTKLYNKNLDIIDGCAIKK